MHERFTAEQQVVISRLAADVREYIAAAREITDSLLQADVTLASHGRLTQAVRLIKDICAFIGNVELMALSHRLEETAAALTPGQRAAPAVVSELGRLLLALEHDRDEQNQAVITEAAVQNNTPVTQPADSQLMAAIKALAGEGLLVDFLAEGETHAEVISNQLLIVLDSAPGDQEALADLFRRVHTVKGNLGLLQSLPPSQPELTAWVTALIAVFQKLETLLDQVRKGSLTMTARVIDICYEAMDCLRGFLTAVSREQLGQPPAVDTLLAELDIAKEPGPKAVLPAGPPGPPAKAPPTEIPQGLSTHTIRVSEEKLDRLMNLVGELSITKNRFAQIARKLMIEYNLPQASREIKDAGQWVKRVSAELEDVMMSMRMLPVRTVFQKFPRTIRDIAQHTGKQIALVTEGEDTELDKTIIEQIADPLMHLVRNAADHGIEAAAGREAAGKAVQGKITLRAYNQGKHVVIEVEDDGKGLNPQLLKNKAIEKGFISPEQAAELSELQTFQLVFLPGFSTAQTVSEISGRGVGMDVVKNNVAALRGHVSIDSMPGQGTKVTIKLPLTLVVSRGLLTEAAGQSLVFPIDNVLETIKLPRRKIVKYKGRSVVFHRGRVLGIVSLAELLGLNSQADSGSQATLVVLTDGSHTLAMAVDKLITEQEVLIKSLPEYLEALPGMSGATILGDGRVALVLNVAELIAAAT